MNRPYFQAIAILMATIATTVIAAEWRWEPASAGNYLVIVEPNVAKAPADLPTGVVRHR